MKTVLPQEITQQATAPAVERLAFNRSELAQALGVSPITIWRLEKRGILHPVPGIRHKLFSVRAVQRFLDGQEAA